MKENIQTDNEGITIVGETFMKRILWNEITSMNVYKQDMLTTDRVDLDIVYGDKMLTINEDVTGWDNFVQKIEEIFPNIPEGWNEQVIQPPFATNFRTIYTRL